MTSAADANGSLLPPDEFMDSLTDRASAELADDLELLSVARSELIRRREAQSDEEKEAKAREQAAAEASDDAALSLADQIMQRSPVVSGESSPATPAARSSAPPAPDRSRTAVDIPPGPDGDDRPNGVRTVPSRAQPARAPEGGDEDDGHISPERRREIAELDNRRALTETGWRARARTAVQKTRRLTRDLGMRTGDN